MARQARRPALALPGPNRMNRLKHKIAIVTGGGSGIGLAIAERFAAEGAAVVIAEIDAGRGAEAAAGIGGGLFVEHDAGSEDSWKLLMAQVLERYGRVDVLVNNAAIFGRDGPMADPEHTTVENWRAIQRVNLEGTFLGCKHAIAAMKGRGGGSIVNMSSAGAIVPSPMNAPYGAAKAGVLNLTITVAMHCAVKGYGIRCNAVLPGGTRTRMLLNLFETLGRATGTSSGEAEAAFAEQSPLRRLAEPAEIANAVLFLASDEASYITAELLTVDGGGHYPMKLAMGKDVGEC